MAPTDPKSYIWKNVVRLLGVPESTGVDAATSLLANSGLSRGTVQRLREGKTSIGTDIFLKLADHFQIEVWELLTPAGVRSESEALAAASGLESSFAEVERALAKLDRGSLQNVLDTVGLLVTDSGNKEPRRQYVISILSGELPEEAQRLRASNGK